MLFADLPAPTPALAGTELTTTDFGVCYCSGTSWVIIGFPQSTTGVISLTSPGNTINIAGSPGNSITEDVVPALLGGQGVVPGIFTFATLPSASANANMYARTNDVGAVYSAGAAWQILYNPTIGSLGILTGSPLSPATNGTAYSQPLQASGGTAPYTWSLVSTYGTANTVTVTAATLAIASPSTGTTYIVVQVKDNTGLTDQVTLALTIAGSVSPAATPTFSPAAGSYTGTQSVVITSATGSSTIYYTTNGSTPTTGSTSGASPLTISVPASATVKAIATASGSTQSAVGSAAYTINTAGQSFPITYARQLDSPATNFGDTTWQHNMARYDNVAFISFGGIEGGIGGGQTFSSIFAGMKSYALSNLNGHVVKTGLERMNEEWLQSTSVGGGVDPVKIAALNNNLGWALQASGYPSGSKVAQESVYWVANSCRAPWCPVYTINTVGSIAGPSSASGANLGAVTWQQWCAWYEYQADVAGNLHAMGDPNTQVANSHVDFVDCDNRFMGPRSTGCWQSNSTVYTNVFSGSGNTANTVAPHLQQGYSDYAAVRRALQPGCLIVGNTDYFLFSGNGTNPQLIDSSQLGLYDIALCEAPVGQQNAYGTFNSFNNLLNALVSMEQVCTPTGKPCFLMEGSGNGVYGDFTGAQSGWSTSQWRGARYQIGLAALLRHISGVQPQGQNLAYWFDEWDAGVGTLNWMGAPIGTRSFTPNAQGIIVIPYTNGTAYLYPAAANDLTTGLSPITLSSSSLVGGGGRHISYGGYGDPAINTGASFTSLTIQPRDCIFTIP